MNRKLCYYTLLLSLIFHLNTLSQTEKQIYEKLSQQGIKTKKDVLSELKARNMTEDDARRLAKQYGMNYDDFINTYIIGEAPLQPPSIKIETPVTEQPTIIKTEVVTEEKPEFKEEIKPIEPPPKSPLGIEYFGYKLFQHIPEAFEPSAIGPIDPGYLIGPGDVLRLYLWGSVELQYQLEVDAQGTIFIPAAGQFFVSGVAYKDFQEKMRRYLSKFYEGLASDPPTVFLDISLAKLRPLKIFVLGEVPKPGGYNISSFATVFNALYAVGGPLVSGSLREIRVIRNNKVLTTVDLYDYLLKGQLIGDVRLQNNDLIFIPPRGKTVTIKGEILREAVYELKPNESLSDLLKMAGGLKSTAYIGRGQIERIVPFDKRIKYTLDREINDIDLSLILNGTILGFELYDQDIVTIFPILNKLENYVNIAGSVYRPGRYELRKVPTISDLISEAYGILPETYLEKADIIRTKPDETREFISFHLDKALRGDPKNNILLESRDEIKIYSIYDLIDKKSVSISGYVKHPFSITYADSVTLYDMIIKSGGFEDPIFRGRAFTLRGDIIRINPDGVTTRIIKFNLEKLLTEKDNNIPLEPGDKILLYKADVTEVLDKYVTIEGDINKPGRFPLSDDMSVLDVVLQAGGFKESSLRTEAYVNRIQPEGYPGEKLSETFIVKLSLNHLLQKNDDIVDITLIDTFKLQHKDVVVIRKNPDYEEQRIVKISGEIKYPGTYVLEKRNEKISDLLKKVGGPTDEAYLFGTVFKRNDKRVIANLEDLYNKKSKEEDIILLEGDEIFIPREPNTVFVGGEVNNSGLFKFIPGDNVKNYIKRAGGYTDSAKCIIYQMPNGEAREVGIGWFTSNPTVYDGSWINVTKIPPPPPEGEKVVDIAAAVKDIFAITASAVTIIYLVNQIKK